MQTNNDVLLRLPQVLAIVPVAKSTWWGWVKSGKAPAPIKISAGVTCWRKSDIDRLAQGAA